MLTSASDYQDYGNDLDQACSDLVGEHEITSADCEQVQKTVLATEMETPPASSDPGHGERSAPPARRRGPRLLRRPREPRAAATGRAHAIQGPNAFFYPQVPNPLGFDATYATQRHEEHLGIRRRR